MEGLAGFILNAVIVVLLVAAIGYGIILNRKLVALQSAQSELAALLGRLDEVLLQANSTVHAFRSNVSTAAPAAGRPIAPTKPAAKPVFDPAIAGRVEATNELLSLIRNVRGAAR
jgi:hypothetical protein